MCSFVIQVYILTQDFCILNLLLVHELLVRVIIVSINIGSREEQFIDRNEQSKSYKSSCDEEVPAVYGLEEGIANLANY